MRNWPITLPDRPRIAVLGCFGEKNVGDEALLAGALTLFRRFWPEAEFTVFSSDADETAASFGVTSLPGYRMSSPRGLVALVRRGHLFPGVQALTQCDCLVVPGGEMLRTDFGLRAVLSMFERIGLSRLAGKPVLLLGVGAGALEAGNSLQLMRKSLNGMPVLTREPESARRLSEANVGRPYHAADLALLVEPEPHGLALPDAPFVTISLRDPSKTQSCARLGFTSAVFADKIARLADEVVELGAAPVFVPFCTAANDDDRMIHAAVRAKMRRAPKAIELTGELTPGQMLGVLGSSDLVVGMRLHACILGFSAGRPVLGLSYDSKVRKQMEQLGQGRLCVPLERVGDARGVLREFWPTRQAWHERSTGIQERLQAERERLLDCFAQLFRLPVSSRA